MTVVDENRRLFQTGLVEGRDKRTRNPGDRETTLPTSPWLGLVCPVSGHTFRRGDRVEFDNSLTPRLADASEQPVSPAVASFLEGLAGEADEVQALMPGDPRLAPPRGALRRIRCAMCGHTFRAHDLVVVCPCRPDNRLCATTIHQDPGRSLACYDAWLASPLSNYCLANSREMR